MAKISITKLSERFTLKESKQEGILNWDIDNAYPQRIMMMVKASGRAINCTECYAKFIEGHGFKDLTFYKAVINSEGLTMDKLLRSLVDDYSYFKGFAFHVNYNANYKITEIYPVPFEHCRLPAPDSNDYVGQVAIYKGWFNRYMGRNIQKKDISWINVFNPDPEIIQYQVDAAGGWENYKGQIFWYSAAGPGTYPEATLDSVIEDVDTDSQIKIFKNRTVRVGFTDPTLFIHKGVFATEREREDFKAGLNKFQGAEHEGNVMLCEVESTESTPELKPFTSTDKDKKYQHTEESVQDNIRKAVLAPKILVGDDEAAMFDSGEKFNNAAAYYSSITNKERRIFEETFQRIIPLMPTVSNPTNDYSIIPIQKIINSTVTPAAV